MVWQINKYVINRKIITSCCMDG